MAQKILRYKGDKITVTFDVDCCIHAAECVRGLPQVFDTDRKPWVDPDAAAPDVIVEVIARCPSGALKYKDYDAGEKKMSKEEDKSKENNIQVLEDGPLYCAGEVELRSADDVLIRKDNDMALCRCGASKNKPFCDGSHNDIEFKDAGDVRDERAETLVGTDACLVVSLRKDGPLMFKGSVHINGADGVQGTTRNKGALCRCGASKNKPFCDGSHKDIGFTAD